jgi:hypothetical protein
MTVVATLTTYAEVALRAAHTRVRDLCALLPERRPDGGDLATQAAM